MTLPALFEVARDATPAELESALAAVLTPAQIDAALLELRAQEAKRALAADDLFNAFKHFHYCITSIEVSPYAEFIWLPEFIIAYRESTAVMLECHRSAGKTFFMIIWVLFLIWIRPIGSTQYIRISDAVATETDKAVAIIVEQNPGWKMICPHVVPDEKKGWSSEGRNFWDNTVEYGEWTRRTFADHGTEPSLLCAGVTSGSIIGKHPSNGQWFDDLHNEKNTRSALEMQAIVDSVEKDIAATWTRPGAKKPMVGCACTFWSEKDAYHAMLRTGLFRHIKTPMFVYEEKQVISVNGKDIDVTWLGKTPVEDDFYGRKIRSLWHKGYPASEIRSLQKRNPVYFPMMYLCDLSAAKGKVLKREWLAEYPHEKIMNNWPTYFGIDFASTEDKLQKKDTDFFTIGIWKGLPGGGAVLVGGVRIRIGSQEAVLKTKGVASQHPNLAVVAVEKWGKGEVFKDQMLYSSNLPIVPYPLAGTPVRSKGQRFADGLAPLFTSGRAWISDVHDEFIECFIEEWISWDGSKTATGHDDCLDGAYWGAMAAIGHLMTATDDTEAAPRSRSQKRDATRKALSFGRL